jgi:hypothetical protein
LSANGSQRAIGRHGFGKEFLEALLFTAILDRVLLPNQQIGGDGVKVIMV